MGVISYDEEIIATPSHPFYVPKQGWTDAIHLKAGDILLTVNGEYVVVEKVQHELLELPIKVYNFEVEDFHTYYVGDGVLVHNMCAQKGSIDKNRIGYQRGNAPRSNKAQNKQFDSIVNELELNKDQARRLHDKITKKGLSRKEIIDYAKKLFGK